MTDEEKKKDVKLRAYQHWVIDNMHVKKPNKKVDMRNWSKMVRGMGYLP